MAIGNEFHPVLPMRLTGPLIGGLEAMVSIDDTP
jgi:hypothetical protein